MPKKPVRNLDGIRIELQDTERAAVEMWAAGSAAGDILSGVGSILAPFEGAITALTVAYIAEQGLDALFGPAVQSGKIIIAHVEQVLVEGPVDLPRGSLIEKELSWWQKLALRAAGYTW